MRLSHAEIRTVGLDFIEFLHETQRFSVTDRDELQRIYNTEFRNSHGGRDPSFSSLLYVLRKSHRARITRTRHVYFNDKVRVLKDQWWRPRDRQPIANHAVMGVSRAPPSHDAEGEGSPGPEGGVRARRKLAHEIVEKLTNERSEFVADKNGVRVSSETEMLDGRMGLYVDSAQVYEWKVFIENTGQDVVDFTYYSPLHWIPCFKFEDSKKVTRNNPLSLRPGEKYEVKAKFQSKYVGIYRTTVAFEFNFNKEPSPRPFHIVRFIEAEFNTQLARELAPTEPYKPFTLSRDQTDDFNIDEGERPDNLAIQRLQTEVPLLHYKCPDYINDLIDFLKPPRSSKPYLFQKKLLLETPLDFYNYAERFQVLLYLEERQMDVDIKRYNKLDVTMKKDRLNKKLLELEVPGVSENRPSVLRGDHLLLTKTEDLNSQRLTKYKGYVHRVELDKLKLGFSPRLDFANISSTKGTPHLSNQDVGCKNVITAAGMAKPCSV